MIENMEIALGKLSPTDNDIIVVKFNTEECPFADISEFTHVMRDISPCPVIVVPEGVELQLGDIDEMINYLQATKKS